MTVRSAQPAINLRETLAQLLGRKPVLVRDEFYFTGDSSTTDFALPLGWKPFAVYSAGLRQREGSGDDFTVVFDGFIYTISFAVAPAAVDVTIDAEAIQ